MAVVVLSLLTLILGYTAFRYGGVLTADWYLCLFVLGVMYAVSRVSMRHAELLPRLALVARILIGGLLGLVLLQLIPLPRSLLK